MSPVLKRNLGSLFIGLLVALTGGLALGGWLFDFSSLARMLPGIEKMAPNTALAFLLAGVWVALATTGPRRSALMVLGSAVSALAAMVLAQYLTGVLAPGGGLQIVLNTRADRIAAGVFGGRMALGTALALLLSGAAMLALGAVRSKAGMAAAMLCVFCAGFIGMLGAISNILDFEILFFKSGHAHMSLYTALCLVALSIALWGLGFRQAYAYLAPANETGRTVFIASSILLFTTLFAGLLVFSITENHAEEELRSGLARTLNDRSAILQQDVAAALGEAEAVAGRRPLFRKRLLELVEGQASAQTQREIGEVLDNVISGGAISALRLFSADGELMIARGAMVEHPVLSVPLQGAGQAVLLWDKRYVLRVRLSMTEQGRELGSLIVEIPLPTATSMLADFSGLGESGEILMCVPHQTGWMQCFPSRHTAHATLRQRVLDAVPLPMDFALAGQKGVVATLDYRKQRVIAAYAPVGELGLGQVLKIDEAEFYQSARERIGYVLPVLGAMLALGILLIRWQVAPLVRATVNARNRVKATLDNVVEGIITFDEKGRISSFNPAAGRIFGYPPEEALGINVRNLLPGLDATHPQPCESTGRRKDGSEFFMEATVSEVVLDGGRAHIAVVRDMTQRKRAEQALSESEDRFRGTFEQAAVGMAHVSPDGRFLRVNHKLCEIVGYSGEELMARTFQDITYAEDLQADLDNVSRVLADEIPTYDMEKRYIRKDGALVWINLTVSLARDMSGMPEYFIAVIEDISRRKLAEGVLSQQAQIINQTHDAVFSTDSRGTLVSWNRGAELLFGHGSDAAIGQPVEFIALPGEKKLLYHHVFLGLIRSGGGVLETRLAKKSGESFDAWFSLSLLKDNEGMEIGVACYVTDISARKRMEHELRESEARLAKAQQMARLGNWEWEIATGEIQWSDEVYHIFGVDQDTPVTFDLFLGSVHPEDRELVEKSLTAALVREVNFNVDVRLLPAGGEVRFIHAEAEVEFDGGGKGLRMFGTVQDITERKEIEQEIRASREQLRELSSHLQIVREEEKAIIAREIHDELGGNLTALKMDISWLARKLPPEMEDILEKTGSMSDLVDASVYAMRRIVTELRPTVLDDLGLLAAMRWQASEFTKRYGIQCKIAMHGEEILVGDACRIALFRIFQESLTNAARYSKADRVQVDVWREHDKIALDIVDNGIGLPEDTAMDPTSHGLRGMMERARTLGGSVEIGSAPGEGVAISVRIPLPAKEEVST